MVKISCKVGFTLNLGNYQSAQYQMEVADIECDQPLEPQLLSAQEHMTATSAWMENQLFARLRENQLVDTIRNRPVPR